MPDIHLKTLLQLTWKLQHRSSLTNMSTAVLYTYTLLYTQMQLVPSTAQQLPMYRPLRVKSIRQTATEGDEWKSIRYDKTVWRGSRDIKPEDVSYTAFQRYRTSFDYAHVGVALFCVNSTFCGFVRRTDCAAKSPDFLDECASRVAIDRYHSIVRQQARRIKGQYTHEAVITGRKHGCPKMAKHGHSVHTIHIHGPWFGWLE